MIHQQESLDREAEVVNTWYRRYGQVIYRRCLRLLGDLEDSEDAIQTIFLKVLKRLEKSKDGPFRPDDPLKYLYRTATNVCLNKIRSNGRRPEVPQDELVVELASSDRSFTERFEDQEFLRILFNLVPSSTRLMATLHWVDGMTCEEVAEIVDLSVSAVRKRLRVFRQRANAQLRAQLEEITDER